MPVVLTKQTRVRNPIQGDKTFILKLIVLSSELAAYDAALIHTKKSLLLTHKNIVNHLSAEPEDELLEAVELIKVSYLEVDSFSNLHSLNDHLVDLCRYLNSRLWNEEQRKLSLVTSFLFPPTLSPISFKCEELELDSQLDSFNFELPSCL